MAQDGPNLAPRWPKMAQDNPKMAPRSRPGWYWRAETEWMIDVGIIIWDEVKFTFTASAHVAPSFLADRLRRLEDIWNESQAQVALGPVEAKHALNSMFGIWSIVEHYAYKLKVASDPDEPGEASYVRPKWATSSSACKSPEDS